MMPGCRLLLVIFPLPPQVMMLHASMPYCSNTLPRLISICAPQAAEDTTMEEYAGGPAATLVSERWVCSASG